MLTTPEYLSMRPWEALIRMINDYHSLALTPESTQLMDLQPVHRDRANTQVTVVVNRSPGPFNLLPPGDVYVLLYKRIDLDTYFSVDDRHFDTVSFPTTTAALVEVLGERTGIVFSPNDFIHQALDELKGNETVALKAHPRSLRWIGELTLTLKQAKQTLQEGNNGIFTDALMGDLDYPSGRLDYITGALYFIAFDFVGVSSELRQVSQQGRTLEVSRLLAMVNDVDPVNTWVIAEKRQGFNLAGVSRGGILYPEVIYNGPVTSLHTPRTDIANVLVLRLSTFYCNNVAGDLLLHYP